MKTDEKKLSEVFDDLVDKLHDIVKHGEDAVVGEAIVKVSPKPATLNVIRQLLKDNNIQAKRGSKNKLGQLANELPVFSEDEERDAPIN